MADAQETIRQALECLALFTEHGGHEGGFNPECESCLGLAALDSLVADLANCREALAKIAEPASKHSPHLSALGGNAAMRIARDALRAGAAAETDDG